MVKTRKVLTGPRMDIRAERLAGEALQALVECARLREALDAANDTLSEKARAFRRYYSAT